MFTLTIKVESLEELESFVASLRHSAPSRLVAEVTAAADKAGAAEHANQQAQATNYDEHDELVAEYTELFGKAPRKNASDDTLRKKIAEKRAKDNADIEQAVHSAQTGEPIAPTLDDAREALKAVTEKSGMDPAMDVLRKFGCVRISEVDSSKYGEFIEACKEAA